MQENIRSLNLTRLIQSNQFNKKYNRAIQSSVKEAINKIIIDNYIGEKKKGDLAAYYVYKFKISTDLYLLAYRIINAETISLEAIGSHENFYKGLKRK
jgi:mRNA interferase RelE/StbE